MEFISAINCLVEYQCMQPSRLTSQNLVSPTHGMAYHYRDFGEQHKRKDVFNPSTGSCMHIGPPVAISLVANFHQVRYCLLQPGPCARYTRKQHSLDHLNMHLWRTRCHRLSLKVIVIVAELLHIGHAR